MATQWGRKEQIIWQPHMPVYTYSLLATTFLCGLLFFWENYTFQKPEIERAYTVEYARASIGAQFHQHGKYRLILLTNGRRERLATAADFEEGTTNLPDGATLPVTLSEVARKQGFTTSHRGPAQSYSDTSMQRWLRGAIFNEHSLLDTYVVPAAETLLILVAGLFWAVPRDMRRLRELKYGRRLKGPIMLDPKAFNREVKGDGIGIQTAKDRTVLRIPRANEAQHLEIIGDTGSGKTTLIMQYLQQIQERDESAIIYDPACEFVKRFYNPKRGDVILNPLDARCPYWGPAEELRRKAEAKTIAASLYQPTSDKKGEFFTETPQKIFAHLLTFGPTPQQLVAWMSNPAEIDQRVKGTEIEQIIAKGAQQQRAGVLASLGLIADSLRLLPTREQTNGKTWSATTWAEHRAGWIFITSQATEREALRPLHSLWIDLLVLRLMSVPRPDQRAAWFVLDELASLQRLPQLHTAITENRKSKNPLILGFQGKAQLETIYGHLAEVMLSQPATKIFLKTTEPKAAEWVSKAIGQVEIERMRETHQHGTRHGKSFTIDRQTEPLVMDSEISGLADKHAFLKLGNHVARFNFAYTNLPATAPAFEPRAVEDDQLAFDPFTLKPHPIQTPECMPADAMLPQDLDEDDEADDFDSTPKPLDAEGPDPAPESPNGPPEQQEPGTDPADTATIPNSPIGELEAPTSPPTATETGVVAPSPSSPVGEPTLDSDDGRQSRLWSGNL